MLSTSLLSTQQLSSILSFSLTMSNIFKNVPRVPRICPSIVDIRMSGLFEALVERDDTRINRLCDAFIKHMDEAKTVLFTHDEAEDVKDKILYIQLLCFMNLHDVAIDTAAEIQNICRDILHVRMGVINHLKAIWGVPELNKEFALGHIDDLPSLVKYQIAECLRCEYNLV